MDLDLPLIFASAVAVTGLIALIDKLFLAKNRGNNPDPALIDISKSVFPVLAFVFVLRSFLYEPFQIPSSSMEPTLDVGDFILVNKFDYGIRLPIVNSTLIEMNSPQRGDVMVFFPPNDPRYFIKRVIGLPGDRVQVKQGMLYVNGELQPQELVMGYPVNEPRVLETTEQLGEVSHRMFRHVQPGRYSEDFNTVVPEGHYFMMGDNRDNSRDSREWGPVPEANIVGKAVYKWMHWDEFFSVPSFSNAGPIN
ncbi:signal peptidase I [uncultured Umboniibacter sp.]|uniref:signal peptidase I n=1 Tax=uncultured Umboniibacter sp. TaxID=1798917 RepID=UPI002613BBD6|nr:signal peptidase I [uncultured Umboniibacter sp.]